MDIEAGRLHSFVCGHNWSSQRPNPLQARVDQSAWTSMTAGSKEILGMHDGHGFEIPDLNSIRTHRRGGPPVVLVHPVGLELSYWGMQIEALQRRYDVIAYDLPGHGRSPGSPKDWTLDKAAALLARVVRSGGTTSAHIVGLSVGGMIAQAMTLAEPALALSLTLIDTAASFPDAAREGMRARAKAAREGGMQAVLQSTIERWFTTETVAQRPDIVDRVTKTLLADDPAVHAALWDMISALNLVPELHRITCPTLILVGEFDPSSPPAAAQTLAENIPGASMHIIPHASHMAPLEKPEAINTHLLSFLASLE